MKFEVVTDRATAVRFLSRWVGIKETNEILSKDDRSRIALPIGASAGGYSTRRDAADAAKVVAEVAAHQAGRLGKPLTAPIIDVKRKTDKGEG